MQRLPDRLRHGFRALVSTLALTCWLTACGPGTGGTGTGPVTGASFYGTSAQPLAPGMLLPCGGHCDGQALLTIGPQRVELSLPCQRFVHAGDWAFDHQGRAELAGQLTRLVLVDGQTEILQLAVRLVLQKDPAAADDASLSLVVTDLAGQTLLGPLGLERQANGGAVSACSPSSDSEEK